MSTWIWGVDTSSKAMDVGFLDTQTRESFALTCHLASPGTPFAGAKSLNDTLMKVTDWCMYLPMDREPSLIVVESPFAQHGAQQQMMVFAVILAALAGVYECPIQEVSSSSWKATIGNGAWNKGQVMTWAREEMDYKGTRQDHADALGCAVHGARLWNLGIQHGDVA